ncbi:MAG TPA: DUF2892 domain-containing protein [Anaerolineae bacterium]
MKANMAGWDRIARIVLSVVLLYLGLASVVTGSLGLILEILGVVFLLTGIVGWCPIYALFGLKTKRA